MPRLFASAFFYGFWPASAYAHGLTDRAGSPRWHVDIQGWVEALRSPRVQARPVERIALPRRLISVLAEKVQRVWHLSRDPNANAIARSFIASFKGFVPARVIEVRKLEHARDESRPNPARVKNFFKAGRGVVKLRVKTQLKDGMSRYQTLQVCNSNGVAKPGIVDRLN